MNMRSAVWIHYDLMYKPKDEDEWALHSKHQSKYAALAKWEELAEAGPDCSWQVVVCEKSRRVLESKLADEHNSRLATIAHR